MSLLRSSYKKIIHTSKLITDIMNRFLLAILSLATNVILAAQQDFSGSYHFLRCSCTVLRCLEPSPYQMYHSPTGHMTVNYRSSVLAAYGQITPIENGRQTQISMQWTPGMDFDTNCTGLWIPTKRMFDLKCRNQQRYCTAQLECQKNSGPCFTNASNAFNSHLKHIFTKIIVGVIFVCLTQKFMY